MKNTITSFLLQKKGEKNIIFIVISIFIALFYCVNTTSGYSTEKPDTNGILIKYKNSEKLEFISIDKNDLNTELKKLNEDKSIEYAEPNYIYKSTIIPSDTYFNKQWYLKKVMAREAWNIVRDSPEVVIAIIDTGVLIDHPDLRDNIWINDREIKGNKIDDDNNGFIDDVNGWDFVNNTPDPSPKFSEGYTEDGIMHGTIVAGVAAASGNNATGITGVTWTAKIMSLKVLNDKGEGDTRNVIKAIDYAIANGADVINFSFVGSGYSQSLQRAIEKAYKAGVIMVAAAGNDEGQGTGVSLNTVPLYPVCHDGGFGENMIIGVAATDALDQKTEFSGYGSHCIDVSAPGVSIFSTVVGIGDNPKKYYDGYWSGTSMAVPIVSGEIALIKAVNPRLKSPEIFKIVMQGTDNINKLNPEYIDMLGSGRINLYNSVSIAKNKLLETDINLLTVPQSDHLSNVKITNKKGVIKKEFLAFDDNVTTGVNVSSGDIDGDGNNEIIIGAGNGGGPQVRIFDEKGELKGQFFAYAPHFRGGVNVTTGDVDGDGIDEIITGAGFGGGPHIRIFNKNGELRGQFFAYATNFRGGVNVTAGDVDGNGVDEIITGAGFGGGPQVRIFDMLGNVQGQFFAYDKNFRGGVNVVSIYTGNGHGGNKNKIITSPGKSGGPHIKMFDNHGDLYMQFFAYAKDFKGGVNIASGDIDLDGYDEIITGAGITGGPHVKIFDKNAKLKNSFYAFEKDFTGGVKVSSIEMKN